MTRLLIICVFLIAACSSETNTDVPGLFKYMPPESSDKFEYVGGKTEHAGTNENSMELYAIKGDFDFERFKVLCNGRKYNFRSGTFYYLVLFDSKENAAFPTDPFTAAYGTEEPKLRHIKALYTYNRKNGYSKLSIYKKIVLRVQWKK
jgi:hypothetical protein